jgi:hypothetical protein
VDTETNFELWRTHVLRGTRCPNELKDFVWKTADGACGILSKRVEGKLSTMSVAERVDFRNDMVIRFLEFMVENPTRGIGWCFKTFKMRYSNAVTELEARNLGLGVKRSSGIQTYELKKLGMQLKENRTKEKEHPLLEALAHRVGFDEDWMDIDEDGNIVVQKVNQ